MNVEAISTERTCSAHFRTTHWSVIEQARGPLPESASTALNHLCSTYWRPLYAHARRKGLNHHDANDAIQDLFQKLLRNEFLDGVGPERGRFRTFLLVCLDRHLNSIWSRNAAGKRGANAEHLPLDSAHQQQDHGRSPDQEFDYQWMLALVAEVLARLKAECEAEGKGALFAQLKSLLVRDETTIGTRQTAQALGMSDEAVRAALTRLRRRYRQLFRDEIARTLANPFDVDDEIRQLFQSLRTS